MRNYISEHEFAYHPFSCAYNVTPGKPYTMFDDIYAVKLIAIERKFLFIRIGRNIKIYRKDSEEICKKKKFNQNQFAYHMTKVYYIKKGKGNK